MRFGRYSSILMTPGLTGLQPQAIFSTNSSLDSRKRRRSQSHFRQMMHKCLPSSAPCSLSVGIGKEASRGRRAELSNVVEEGEVAQRSVRGRLVSLGHPLRPLSTGQIQGVFGSGARASGTAHPAYPMEIRSFVWRTGRSRKGKRALEKVRGDRSRLVGCSSDRALAIVECPGISYRAVRRRLRKSRL